MIRLISSFNSGAFDGFPVPDKLDEFSWKKYVLMRRRSLQRLFLVQFATVISSCLGFIFSKHEQNFSYWLNYDTKTNEK